MKAPGPSLSSYHLPEKNKLPSLLGTKNKVPTKHFNSTTLSRKELGIIFQKEKGNRVGWVSSPSSSCRDYEELQKINTETLVRVCVFELQGTAFYTHQTQTLLREEKIYF